MKKTLVSIEKNKIIVYEKNQYLFKKIKESLREMEITIDELEKLEKENKELLIKQMKMLNR